MTHATTPDGQRASQWLSHGLEVLFAGRSGHEPVEFDVVVVGSGYGGAVAAAALAGRFERVCVLERGSEYLAGMFPARASELAGHVRFSTGRARPRGVREGLFDVRVGADVCAVVANGLGGGSLINAGVMEAPSDRVLDDPAWPSAVRGDAAFRSSLRTGTLLQQLGAEVSTPDGPLANTLARSTTLSGGLDKVEALNTLAGRVTEARGARITIGMAAGDTTSAGMTLNPCIGCGDCATGCNHGAKNSLDLNLLVQARRQGAQIYTGATVLRLEPACGGWQVIVNHTDEALRRRQRSPLVLQAGRVVLAAGCLGSTEILMRSRNSGLRFSGQLGQRFSTNGDVLSAVHDLDMPVHAVGDVHRPGPPQPLVGPTITGLIDLRSEDREMVIEDLSVPAPLRALFEEAITTAATLHGLVGGDRDKPHSLDDWRDPHADAADPCAVDPRVVERSLLLATMWRDGAAGQLYLAGGDTLDDGDGAVGIRWPGLRDDPGIEAVEVRLEALRRAAGRGGRILSNPLWRLLPGNLEFVLGADRGPVLTVHPLGGCPMGEDRRQGVVDELGRVFDGDPRKSEAAVHGGLVVLDGSIVPTSLGINPALTIAALARRSIDRLLAGEWRPDRTAAKSSTEAATRSSRPVYWSVEPPLRAPAPYPTRVQFIERMCGILPLDGLGPRFVELTLHFEPAALRDLIAPRGDRRLRIQSVTQAAKPAALPESIGRLRIFEIDKVPDFLRRRFGDRSLERYRVGSAGPGASLTLDLPDDQCEWIGDVSGCLRLFRHEDRSGWARTVSGLFAYLLNRGLRDGYQLAVDHWLHRLPQPPGAPSPGDRVRNGVGLASRAGEVRLLEYELTIGRVAPGAADAAGAGTAGLEAVAARLQGGSIEGRKRLTYDCAANPWRQLMEMEITAFPMLDPRRPRTPLQLDLHYLARQGVPLLRIVDQEDQPNALIDLAALFGFLARMLLNVHVWSFRAPDRAAPREIDRLPRPMPGLPAPTVHELPVLARTGRALVVRLTRYPGPAQASAPPVLLIHGYSASGTSFAHPAVRPGLAETLHREGRDVWIVDLRTSPGLPTAREPWSFEEVAYADIPLAVAHVKAATRAAKIDVVAHCMGAAMLSMALLGPQDKGGAERPAEPHWDLRRALRSSLRRVVYSQSGPALMFSPANVLRGFLVRYLRSFLGVESFQFRVTGRPTLRDRLIDRLLATMPYPKAEFRIENPLAFWRRTPWTATRHRMDALYGRDFSLANVSAPFLDQIDDHFGPLSIETVSQGIHFARFNTVTDREGYNAFVNLKQVGRAFRGLKLLSIHGVENGLLDVTTLDHMTSLMQEAGIDHRTLPIESFGHQDCLVGVDAPRRVFPAIVRFLATGSLE